MAFEKYQIFGFKSGQISSKETPRNINLRLPLNHRGVSPYSKLSAPINGGVDVSNPPMSGFFHFGDREPANKAIYGLCQDEQRSGRTETSFIACWTSITYAVRTCAWGDVPASGRTLNCSFMQPTQYLIFKAESKNGIALLNFFSCFMSVRTVLSVLGISSCVYPIPDVVIFP